jgi:hypothetical protein
MARPPSRATPPTADLEHLPQLSDPELRTRWRAAFKQAPPPGSRRDFLLGGLACHLQQRAAGGLNPQAQKVLRDIARGSAQSRSTAPMSLGPLKPGTRLLRTWQSESHEVLVLEKGFSHQGKTYASLSEIARTITGARWSGPLFFGLKPPSPSKSAASGKRGR